MACCARAYSSPASLGQRRRFVARRGGFAGGQAAAFEGQLLGFAARFELLTLGFELLGPRPQHLGLLRIERDLLLAAVDLELVTVHRLARAGRGIVGRRQLDANAGEVVLDFGQPRGGDAFVGARFLQARAGRLDGVRQRAVTPREQHLLPPAHLVAQAGVTAGLGGLPLQRSALLVDFVDDVVEAREVLLRGFELQLGRAAARLVLGDPGGLFDQLAPIGRARAQDHPDLALLDDGVGLLAQAGIHQQFVDVLQPARLAVDQVFALTRPIQPARHLDLAGGLLDELARCSG